MTLPFKFVRTTLVALFIFLLMTKKWGPIYLFFSRREKEGGGGGVHKRLVRVLNANFSCGLTVKSLQFVVASQCAREN